MENDNLTKTEFMSIRCLEMTAAGIRQRRQELNAAIVQLQREDEQFAKDQLETFADIEDAHKLEAGSLGKTHGIEPLVQGQSARIVRVQGVTNNQTKKPDTEPNENQAAASVN